MYMKLGRPMRVGREWRFISGGKEKDFFLRGAPTFVFFSTGKQEECKNAFLFIDTKPLIFRSAC